MSSDAEPRLSAQHRLSEIRLRLDDIGVPSPAALLVEGPDDRRLFLPFAKHPPLVVPCGGRRKLLEMRTRMTDADRKRMLIVTDCDHEVALGNLKGGSDIVITNGTDVESDMLRLGLLSRVIHHLLPREFVSVEEVRFVAGEILDCAIRITTPLGRARMAAQPLGVPIDLKDFRFGKHRLSKDTADVDKIVRTVHGQLRGSITLAQFRSLYDQTPDSPHLCKGKDLLEACVVILREDYRWRVSLTADVLDVVLRACMGDRAVFGEWAVVKRICRWEEQNRREILDL